MSNERDELAAIISQPEKVDHGPISCGPNSIFAGRVADAILAAGYRKPRTITTTEELDALPSGSVVMSCYGDAMTVRRDNPLMKPADFHHLVKYGPATVLYEPVKS